MRKLGIVALICLLPSLVQAQTYRFAAVQITNTTDGALTVSGGVLCCGGRLSFDATTGDLIDPAGTTIGVREALQVIPTTQAINTDPLFGMATQIT